MWLSWYVSSAGDIADFYVSVKDRDSRQTIQEYHLGYGKRVFNISADAMQNRDNLEICLLAKDSRGKIKKYFNDQCFNMNNDWKNINRKCKSNLKKFCDIFDPKTNRFVDMVSNGSKSVMESNSTNVLLIFNVFFILKQVWAL